MAVDAHEGQDVDTFNTLRRYLHTEKDEDVIVLPEVELSEIMVKAEPKIYKNISS